MIVEERCVDIVVGLVPEHVRHCAANGLPVSLRHGLRLAAYIAVEAGDLHQVVHDGLHDGLHDSLAERQRTRVPRDADPAWKHDQAGARGRATRRQLRLHEAAGPSVPFAAAGVTLARERQFVRPIPPSPRL